MSDLERIAAELRGRNYAPALADTPQGNTVFIEYTIPTGKYRGETVRLGFSFQEHGYPEYPPHWIHISPPHDDGLGGAVHPYQWRDSTGTEHDFVALSRPPGHLWDALPTKHMSYYLDFHVANFCRALK